MTEKSFVSMEQFACQACCTPYDSGNLLIDKRLKYRFEQYTVTAMHGLCPACKAKNDEGYIALVETTSVPIPGQNTIKAEEAHRTGRLLHIRRSAAAQIFDVPPETLNSPVIMIEPEVTDMLIKMMKEAEAAHG